MQTTYPNGTRFVADFQLAAGVTVRGELTLHEFDTVLELHSWEQFDPHAEYITGLSKEGKKISLFRCQCSGLGHGYMGPGKGTYHFARVFPQVVVIGSEHLAPDATTISAIHLGVDDAITLFYDFSAFGSVIHAKPHIDYVLKAAQEESKYPWDPVETGEHPEILYFTGKYSIVSSDTVLGKVSASHSPTFTFPSPSGLSIKNRVLLSIEPPSTIDVFDAIRRTYSLVRFLDLIAGRPQNILVLTVTVGWQEDVPVFLDVYLCSASRRTADPPGELSPNPGEILIQAVFSPAAYSQVLSCWLDKEPAMHDALLRFSSSFAKRKLYDIDRMIASANMFDHLPASAVPPVQPLTSDLTDLVANAKKCFSALPNTPERDSVLNALGLVGKPSLKQKVRSRSKFILDLVSARFPDLDSVTDTAVNCRNFFVHGTTKSKLGYDDYIDLLPFLTDTLEFVFAASILIECGWKIDEWLKNSTAMTHPFDRLKVDYKPHLEHLQKVLQSSSANK
jgi:hypothetical protein